MTKNLKVVVTMGILSGLVAGVAVGQEFKGHPHLRAAHNKVTNALKDLKEANDGKIEFGGHREKAEALLSQALHEVEEAAEFANSHRK